MSETMPENMWMDEADMMASVFFTQEPTPSKGYERYIIKSTVDAEREADSKTIRELAAALGALADDMDIMAYNYAERHFVAKRKDPIASRFYDAIDSFLESWCEFRWGINWSAGDSTPRPDKAYERLKKNNVNPDYKNVGETALTTHKERIDESQEDKR